MLILKFPEKYHLNLHELGIKPDYPLPAHHESIHEKIFYYAPYILEALKWHVDIEIGSNDLYSDEQVTINYEKYPNLIKLFTSEADLLEEDQCEVILYIIGNRTITSHETFPIKKVTKDSQYPLIDELITFNNL